MRILAITESITVDGSIEMLTNCFDPQRQGDVDKSDLLEEEQRQGPRSRRPARRPPYIRGVPRVLAEADER
jgi:hypothetical protein